MHSMQWPNTGLKNMSSQYRVVRRETQMGKGAPVVQYVVQQGVEATETSARSYPHAYPATRWTDWRAFDTKEEALDFAERQVVKVVETVVTR